MNNPIPDGTKRFFGLRVSKRAAGDPHVLAFGQESLWYLHQLAPGNPAYNVPFVSRLRGHLDELAFKRAFDAVVERHEALRTIFLERRGMPVPVVIVGRRTGLRRIDLRHLPESQREEEAQEQIRHQSSSPFNLSRDLMIRASLFRVSEVDHVFFLNAHHIVFGGWSLKVFCRDFSLFYNAWLAGKRPELPDMALQYSDFAWWQRRALSPERVSLLKDAWKKQLSDAPALNLPLDLPRPPVFTMRGKRRSFSIPPELLSAANALFRDSGSTPFRGFCAVFCVLLYCYTGTTDISLGSPSPPNCRGIEDLIGFFVNTVVLRTTFEEDWTFRQLIRRVDAVVHRAMVCSDLPFHQIVEGVRPRPDPSRNPLFQVNFRVTPRPHPSLDLENVVASPAEYLDNGGVKFDLALDIESSTGRTCYFEYCTDLFRDETIVQMQNNFLDLLRAIVRDPDAPLNQFLTQKTEENPQLALVQSSGDRSTRAGSI